MHVAARRLTDLIDDIRDGQHVVGQGPLQSSLLTFRRAEVNDPWIDAMFVQDRDGAGMGGNVVDLRRQHQRRYQHDRRFRR